MLLHAHHIHPTSTHPDLALRLDNGTTLCVSCHRKEHERNRPPRIRSTSGRPHRATMKRRMEYLEEQLHLKEMALKSTYRDLVRAQKRVGKLEKLLGLQHIAAR